MSSTSSEILMKFFGSGERHEYKKGEYIISPGESSPGVFFIEKGLVKSYYITKYNEENMLAIRKSGELLGVTIAATDSRKIIYYSLSPTVVWLLSREEFEQKLADDPETSLHILHLITEMYQAHSERILNLEYRTVRERLISFLLGMSKRFGVQKNEGLLIDVPLRHQDIASAISATRETTGREIILLERKGWLQNSGLRITLNDIESLNKALE